ncbi:MAG: ATP-dependent DNA helicase [Polaromonas sp.]
MPALRYVVAVRTLCEFTAKQGDLDLRFTPSPSAREGMIGHALVASRRSKTYQSELSLTGDYQDLTVRGRADGYDSDNRQLEEVKTFRGELAAMPDNHRQLHWTQLKVYGWLLCQKLELAGVRLALVYFNIDSQQETVLDELATADSLRQHFEQQCEKFLAWARQEAAHRTARDAALQALAFPHEAFRPGQRELAEAVYKAASRSRCLMAQAPTGIGKTMATVFPLLKAVPRQALDKVFFLAAKTSGRRLALDALALVKKSAPALALRVVELVARDKACEHPDKACDGESCPLAQGFYDRLPQARSAALEVLPGPQLFDKAALRDVALAHGVCPYYLSQEMVRWSDVVVGDYNYYFDSSAMLHALTVSQPWRVGVLVDEAHNLVDRARQMYSASLDQEDLARLRRVAAPALKKPLERLNRAWRSVCQEAPQDSPHESPNETPNTQPPYQVRACIPAKFLQALQQATSAIADEQQAHPAPMDAALQRFYFDALHFARMAESFGAHSLFDITQDDAASALSPSKNRRSLSRLGIRNVVPAPFLAPRFASAQSMTLFSATLRPQRYYADLLGLPDDTLWLDVASPFAAEQLKVEVVSNLSTRYQHREQSLPDIVDLVARQFAEQPGNYLVFLSSHGYLQQLVVLFRQRHPHIATWHQTRRMDEAERDGFLARFGEQTQGIGFAVLGGAFGEAIDLPGTRLVGAFIATLGLPQFNPVNEAIRRRMGENFGARAAHDYTYLYPGLQKVVQAAGRVIRTTSDTGVVVLMDDRFARPEVRRLLPDWWQIRQISLRQTPALLT